MPGKSELTEMETKLTEMETKLSELNKMIETNQIAEKRVSFIALASEVIDTRVAVQVVEMMKKLLKLMRKLLKQGLL